MRPAVLISALLLSCYLFGCGRSQYLIYNFNRGHAIVSTVGQEMLNFTNLYKDDATGALLGSFIATLTYSGKQGPTLKIFYREESNGYARPAFTQELTYDISSDSTLTFRNTRIQVIEATNSLVKFVVLESPAYKYRSGDKIPSE